MKAFNFSNTATGNDPGLACLAIVSGYYGKDFDLSALQKLGGVNNRTVTLHDVSRVAEKLEFRSRLVKLTPKQLLREVPLPCILELSGGRFIVLAGTSGWPKKSKAKCIDPAAGAIEFPIEALMQQWAHDYIPGAEPTGNALLLEPTFRFHMRPQDRKDGLTWRLVLKYFRQSRRQFALVVMSMLLNSVLQLFFPLLMQSIVDIGINTGDLNYIIIILCAQATLIFSKSIGDFIRTYMLLRISTIVNLSILSDFWIKLTRLPVSYFESTLAANILTRLNDNRIIQNFLVGPALRTIFTMLNFVVFAIVLYFYKAELLFIFLGGLALYVLWIRSFFPARRRINNELFQVSSKENNATLQLVQGMQEIRMNNIEQFKRWEWEGVQAQRFRINIKNLKYSQLQQIGAVLINEGKDLVLTFTVASLVIQGQLTFGAMLALQYIIGQLSGPIDQIISFIQTAQDVKISMGRLNEIHRMQDEEKADQDYIMQLPASKSISIRDLTFAYPGNNEKKILNKLNLDIPEGKTTAIVGVSGCGKTTLLKLLLKFYNEYEGSIKIGNTSFSDINPSWWRKQCAAVLQDGYIFDGTILTNIALGNAEADYARLIEACRMANFLPFIESLPDGFDAQIGERGIGLSQGQKQRLLIARAIYKDAHYLLLDESTNALDANNERTIIENLQSFFKGRTVVVVAHRFSTIKNADNIIVVEQGNIIEQGTHQRLSQLKGRYFELVKDQLELG